MRNLLPSVRSFRLLPAFLLFLTWQAPLRAEDPPPILDLDTCRRIAVERQPALIAYRASLAAAQSKVHSLESMKVPTFLRPDLPTRRKQAGIGVTIIQAMYMQQENETLYAVDRTYLTYLFAREQSKVAKEQYTIVNNLEDATKGLAGQKGTSVTPQQYERVRALQEFAAGRQQEAVSAMERAKAALREAMGVGPDCSFEIPEGKLKGHLSPVTRDQVLALALERRWELVQALGASEVTALEIQAQQKARGRSVITFAAAADIHAQPVVQGLRDGEYRPGAVGLDFPTHLNGSKHNRAETATHLAGRADAVYEKARGLITLDAQDVFYRYLDYSNKAPRYRAAATISEARAVEIRKRFEPRIEKPRANLDEVLDASWMATTFLLQANEAEYLYNLILADLRRVTVGGLCPEYLIDPNGNNGAAEPLKTPPKPTP